MLEGMSEAKERVSTRQKLRVIDRSVLSRVNRIRSRFVYIVQATIGAALAYWVAGDVVGHPQPFFAPISAVIILGMSGGDRMKKALEMSIGGIIGVAVGDLLFQIVGQGPFQIFFIVGAGLVVGSFLTKSPLITNQIVFGAILIATIFPPTEGPGGLHRAIDAMIGSGIGLITIALIPNSPLVEARREVSKVLKIASSILADVTYGIRQQDPAVIRDAREAVRGTQDSVNTLLSAAQSGREASEVSPLLWASRRSIRSLERILMPVDNAVRGVRVLSRQALGLTEDRDKVSDAQVELLDELSEIMLAISELYGQGKQHGHDEAIEIPDLVQRLRIVGGRAGLDIIDREGTLSAYMILGQTRSIVVDMLMVCGLSRESAVAHLVPTSQHPAYPPEVWGRED